MRFPRRTPLAVGMAVTLVSGLSAPSSFAKPLPGGTLDPLTIPKYVTPLVIPPVMDNTGTANTYDIAVRQFKQQILPGGIWATLPGCTRQKCTFPATTVWGYGPSADPTPAVAPAANSQFNYPAYTIETTSTVPVSAQWHNELVVNPDDCFAAARPRKAASCNYLPHLLPVDRSLHWANPELLPCMDGNTPPNARKHTDCMPDPADSGTLLLQPYTGPVPMVVHVHGAHVDGNSDGYPDAWWLPAANNIPAGYATSGTLFSDAIGNKTGAEGYVDFHYRNDGPAKTDWYHDHSLGITRLNVYAGPAGFWLIRGGDWDGATVYRDGATVYGTNRPQPAVLPGPAPARGQRVLDLNVPGNAVRSKIREIPMVIQDRSFNANGSLFYPASRAFFDGYTGPYAGSRPISTDIAPIWNTEAFFNAMVVNGVTWPVLEVAQAKYRFRLLDGCNSRFLNLALFQVVKDKKNPKAPDKLGAELPFYQIGAEQGQMPKVVEVRTGFATTLPGNGTLPVPTPAADPAQALLMASAERADVIVDFSGLPNGTVVRMINTGPDAPFGGFPVEPPADPSTTGQVMQFVVNSALNGMSPTDPTGATPATAVQNLVLKSEAATNPLPAPTNTRQVSLNEEVSGQVCVKVNPAGKIKVLQVLPPPPLTEGQILAACAAVKGVPMGPKSNKVGIVDLTNTALPAGIPLDWTDESGTSPLVPVTLTSGRTVKVPVTENPRLNAVEDWQIYNFTEDAHPIHLHLVEFQVINRAAIPGVVPAPVVPVPAVAPTEAGFKDTVIAYPGQITTIRAKFDIAGLYVWHCHIVEHEDNEMMRPFVVSPHRGRRRPWAQDSPHQRRTASP